MSPDRYDRLRRLLQDFMTGESEGGEMKFPADISWEPAVDIIETTKEIIVIADIAGMKAEDINVLTDGNILRISGIRRGVFHPGEKQFHKLEIQVGRFVKEIKLPAEVGREGQAARYENGLLKVILVKSEGGRGVKRIRID